MSLLTAHTATADEALSAAAVPPVSTERTDERDDRIVSPETRHDRAGAVAPFLRGCRPTEHV